MAGARPILGITMGDPSGIGPEIMAKAMARDDVHDVCRPLAVGDAGAIRQGIAIAGVSLAVRTISDVDDAEFTRGTVDVLDLDNVDIDQLVHGKVSAMAGNAAFEAIERVIQLALEGQIDGTVTAPIHKEAWRGRSTAPSQLPYTRRR
jgi:4-hydroxythreonine-4-phosphate dehydrogenase